MKIDFTVAASAPPLRWQHDLARRLTEAGHDLRWRVAEGAPSWPDAVHLMLDLERLVYRRRGRDRPSDRVPRTGQALSADAGEADLVVDLSGGEAAQPDALRLFYDGSPDPAAAVVALIDRRLVRLDAVRGTRVIATGRPGNEEPALLSAGLDALFARAADLCCSAVARIAAGEADAAGAEASPAGPSPNVMARAVGFCVGSLAAKARGVLLRRLRQPEAWRVGLRRLGPRSILDQGHVTPEGFAWLRDDGARYYADPFLLTHGGRTWLFVEEYPYATGKGVISACEVFPDRTFGPARVVLEAAAHLSYPLVFVRDGAAWMMPESSAAGELVLYRATDFPWHWQRERVLVAGEALSDATPVIHQGKVWLFATATGSRGGSSSDALSLFHASDLFGDFRPHPLNPVLVDAELARPGGRMVWRGDRLLRVAQDCRTGYGRAAVLATVDRLDLGGYRQTPLATFKAPRGWGASGLHSIEVGERFEAVDILSATVPPDAARA